MPRANRLELVLCECASRDCRGSRRVSHSANWKHILLYGHMDDHPLELEDPVTPERNDGEPVDCDSDDKPPPDPGGKVNRRPKVVFDKRDDVNSDSDDGESNELLLSRLCVEFVGLVTEKKINQAGLMAVCDLLNRRLGRHMPIVLPKTYYSVLKAATYKPMEAFPCVWPLCECRSYAFPPGETICKKCGTIAAAAVVVVVVVAL